MKVIIAGHNQKIVNKVKIRNKDKKRNCNCMRGQQCPLEVGCLEKSLVYRAKVKNSNKFYYGLTANTFKSRYNRHLQTFRNQDLSNDTKLAEHIWSLKNGNRQDRVVVEWEKIENAQALKQGGRICNLCNTEKYHIIMEKDGQKMLNKKTEFVAKCRHERQYMLQQVKNEVKKGNNKEIDERKVKECKISLGQKYDCLKNHLLSPKSKMIERCITQEPYVRLTRINLNNLNEYIPQETQSQRRVRISNRKYYNDEFIT